MRLVFTVLGSGVLTPSQSAWRVARYTRTLTTLTSKGFKIFLTCSRNLSELYQP